MCVRVRTIHRTKLPEHALTLNRENLGRVGVKVLPVGMQAGRHRQASGSTVINQDAPGHSFCYRHQVM